MRTHLLLSLFAAAFTTYSHAADVKTQPLTKVSICVPYFREEFLTLALMEAKDRGYFAAQGLDVTLVPVMNAPRSHRKTHKTDMPPNLMNDFNVAMTLSTAPETCQFGASNIERFITRQDLAISQSMPLLISSYGKDYDTHLVVAKGSSIKSIKDLKGKRVRLGQAPVRMALSKILEENGMSLSDIQQDYTVPSTQVLAKLEAGELDAAVTYVPTMPYMLASGKVRVLMSNIIKGYVGAEIPHSLVIANRQFAESSPQVVKSLIQAIDQASEYMRRNPAEAIYTLQRNSKLLGHGEWQVTKITAEKAGEFVGKINTINLFSANAKLRAQTLANFKTYSQLLVTHGMIAHPVNLTEWLGADAKDSKLSSL